MKQHTLTWFVKSAFRLAQEQFQPHGVEVVLSAPPLYLYLYLFIFTYLNCYLYLYLQMGMEIVLSPLYLYVYLLLCLYRYLNLYLQMGWKLYCLFLLHISIFIFFFILIFIFIFRWGGNYTVCFSSLSFASSGSGFCSALLSALAFSHNFAS